MARRAAEDVRQRSEREAKEVGSEEPDDVERVSVAAEDRCWQASSREPVRMESCTMIMLVGTRLHRLGTKRVHSCSIALS